MRGKKTRKEAKMIEWRRVSAREAWICWKRTNPWQKLTFFPKRLRIGSNSCSTHANLANKSQRLLIMSRIRDVILIFFAHAATGRVVAKVLGKFYSLWYSLSKHCLAQHEDSSLSTSCFCISHRLKVFSSLSCAKSCRELWCARVRECSTMLYLYFDIFYCKSFLYSFGPKIDLHFQKLKNH